MPFLNFNDLNYLQRRVAQEALTESKVMEPSAAYRFPVNDFGTLTGKPHERRPVGEYYDPLFGNERECECGHPYERHFDSYGGDDEICRCKYCDCREFKEK